MSPNRAGVVLTVLLAVAGAVVAAPVPATPAIADSFKFLPDDTNLFFVVRMDQITSSDGYKKLLKEVPSFEKEATAGFKKEFGIELSNVELIVLGGNVKGEPAGVFRLKNAIKPADVVAAATAPRYQGDKTTFTEEKVGAYTVHVPSGPYRQAVCIVNDKTIAIGRPVELKKVLARDKKAEFSANLAAALKAADLSSSLTVLMDVPSVLTADPPPAIPGVDFAKIKNAVDGACLNIKVGKEIMVRGVAVCKDAKAAEVAKTQAEAIRAAINDFLKQAPQGAVPKDLLDLPNKVQFTTKDNLGFASVAIPDDTVIAWFKLIAPGQPKTTEAKPPSKPVEKKND